VDEWRAYAKRPCILQKKTDIIVSMEVMKTYKFRIEIFGCAERTGGTPGTHTPGESGVARSSNQEATRFSGW